jgi:ABC-type antimicrobial peptide transport system permease subunit
MGFGFTYAWLLSHWRSHPGYIFAAVSHPIVIVLAAVSIFLLALAASVIPACRAASIEPMQALRSE